MLECVAQNNRDAPNNLMFYWYHNDSRISDEDIRRMIAPPSEDNATRVARSMLMVTNVNRNEGGLYRCSVFNRNITDKDTATTNVTVYCKWSALLLNSNGKKYTLSDEYSDNFSVHTNYHCRTP